MYLPGEKALPQVSTNEPLAHEQSKCVKNICTRIVTYVFERVFDDDAISHQTRAVTKPVELRRCSLMRLVVGVGEMDVSMLRLSHAVVETQASKPRSRIIASTPQADLC